PQQVRRLIIQKQLFTEPVQTPGQLSQRIIPVRFILPVTLSDRGIRLPVTDTALRQVIVLIPRITFINSSRRNLRDICPPCYLCGDTPAAVILRPLIKPAGEPVAFPVQPVAAVFRQYSLFTLYLNKIYLTISTLMANLVIRDIY
ncbi:hypothetical protein, partial [Morganella morganii]|uniref:hypothetical protein n=1 Tax=Morganella morganii TaxID=582 RepID=UPI00091B7B50